MSLVISDEIKANAEVYCDHDLSHDKSNALLAKMGLPNDLLSLKDIIEYGYDKVTDFVWLIQKAETKHRFNQIEKLVLYATEVIEKNMVKKLNGVKSKKLLIWVKLNEISVEEEKGEVKEV